MSPFRPGRKTYLWGFGCPYPQRASGWSDRSPHPTADASGHSLLLGSGGVGKRSWIHASPQRCLVGDASGRLIAVEVEVQRDHALATEVEGAKGGYARPRLVEPRQGVVRILGDVLRHAA